MACPETETLQAFVEARLDSSSREEVITHVDGCPICRSVLVDWARGCSRDDTGLGESPAGEPASVLDLQRGTKLDHFVVLEPLGSGGMGMVVSAYDPDLDRKVAIKLMRPDGPGSSDAGERRARLVREAQALAKLSHENVITVYQAGTFGEHVYIAMELVEGGTLSTWLRRTRRAWREVVAMFLRVGSGLAAAHAAGFVHRDFKPENVLVGDDGRVRVTDFGLVDTAGSTGGGSSSPSSPVLSSLTRTGTLVGTPRYMAPEQHARKRLDARADQFAFAVSLHEALYAVPPFLGGSYDELVTNVRAGTVRPPPPRAKVPAWLRRIVLRGLAPAPDDRYPSMAALMADLARDPGRWRRRIVALGAVATLVTAAVLVTWRAGGVAEPPCSGAEQNLAGVWDAASKARARIAFLATGTPFAEDAWRATDAPPRRLHRRLDPDAPFGVSGRPRRRAVGAGPRPAHGLPRTAPGPRARVEPPLRLGRLHGGRAGADRGGGAGAARWLRRSHPPRRPAGPARRSSTPGRHRRSPAVARRRGDAPRRRQVRRGPSFARDRGGDRASARLPAARSGGAVPPGAAPGSPR
jgi:hypothetical protein